MPAEGRRWLAAVPLLVLFLFWSDRAPAAVTFAGNVLSTSVAPDTVDMVVAGGAVARIQMLDSDLVRVRVSPAGTFGTRLSGAIAAAGLTPPGAAIHDSAGAAYLITSAMTVVVLKAPFRVVVLRPDGSLVVADQEVAVGWDADSGLVFNRKYAPPDEHYFGLGFRGGPIDRRGRRFVLANTDNAAYGEFSDPLYSSFPFYYGVRGGKVYGLFFDNPAIPFFNMVLDGTDEVLFGALDGEIDYYVMAGPEPARVARTYAALTGFTALPPKWSLGYHQSRFDPRSQAEYLEVAAEFRSRRIPADVLYFDLYYMDLLQIFSWDPVRFPDPVGMNTTLESMGFKRVNIIDPVIHVLDRLWPTFDHYRFFLTDAQGRSLINDIFYGTLSWIDFTRSQTRAAYKDLLKIFLSTGVTAVWNDLNEPARNFMPEAVYDFDGERRSDLQARNLYALNNVSLTSEALRELRPGERPWIIARSGYAGIQRYAANWSGDALSTFDALRVSVQISNSMGLSGQNFFGHDIGGFLGDPSPELFIRWLAFGSYIPLFRNHSTDTSLPREPWVFGEPYTSMAKSIIEQRYRLLPYLYSLFAEAAAGGQPPVAPTLFHFPADEGSYAQDQEFMLGPQLLVAPVVQEGATTRTVYLPSGSDWVDYYTDAVHQGGQTVNVPAPLDRIPVFVRAGSLLPGGPVVQHVGEPVAPLVRLDVYPGPASEFVLYEDDGATLDYARGVFLRTRLSRTAESSGTEVGIVREQGSWAPPARPWWIYLHGTATLPTRVRLNGEPLAQVASESDLSTQSQGWYYRPSERQLVVLFQDSPSALALTVQ
ncbi:MAG TPA: glycoside hydrolase family 31 protein [Myxococcota bacterium]|jgi:alpha-glucosidase